MKKRLFMILCTALLSSQLTSFASNLDVEQTSMTKSEFVEHIRSTRQDEARSSSTIQVEDAERLAARYITSDMAQKDEIEGQLNAAGYYIYKDDTSDEEQLSSEPSDISVSGVVTVYDDNTGNWSLVAGGTWNNLDAIYDDAGFWIWHVGRKKDIGGYDAIGIVIYDTSGITPELLSSWGEINNGEGESKKLSTASAYDTKRGVGFEFQDYITVTKAINTTEYEFNYMGAGYSAAMRFDSSFTNWNGTSRGFYAHTWDETTIDSIGFNAGQGTFGLDVSWSTTSDHFLGFSTMDTKF